MVNSRRQRHGANPSLTVHTLCITACVHVKSVSFQRQYALSGEGGGGESYAIDRKENVKKNLTLTCAERAWPVPMTTGAKSYVIHVHLGFPGHWTYTRLYRCTREYDVATMWRLYIVYKITRTCRRLVPGCCLHIYIQLYICTTTI